MIRLISISVMRRTMLTLLLLGVHIFVGCVNSTTESDVKDPVPEWNTGVSLRQVESDIKTDIVLPKKPLQPAMIG